MSFDPRQQQDTLVKSFTEFTDKHRLRAGCQVYCSVNSNLSTDCFNRLLNFENNLLLVELKLILEPSAHRKLSIRSCVTLLVSVKIRPEYSYKFGCLKLIAIYRQYCLIRSLQLILFLTSLVQFVAWNKQFVMSQNQFTVIVVFVIICDNFTVGCYECFVIAKRWPMQRLTETICVR